MMATREMNSHPVLVLAPIGRDAAMSVDLLSRAGVHAAACASTEHLLEEMNVDVGAVVIAEEALFGKDMGPLSAWVSAQPAWSDLPFVVLTTHLDHPKALTWRQTLIESLRNVSLLERPVQAITLISAVKSAIRARSRQFEVRALLDVQKHAALELENLVRARTQQLESANDQLRMEIAERARIEASLRQAQRIEAIGQLTGGVAHDFNNLLMVILGGLEMLARHNDPDRRQVIVNGMRQAAQRGASLTRQLLAFSRRQALQPQPIDLRRQIGGMRDLLDRSLGGDVHVTLTLPPDIWPVQADPAELELVLLNLTVNARDAMPHGGTIAISAVNRPGMQQGELQGDYVCLAISDSGTGMTEDVKARVFEPFFTTKEVGKGSGLGLAQVYGFVKQSRGSVEISTEVGCGTTVRVLLPRATQMPSHETGNLIDLHMRREADSAGSILLVEDNDEVAALVTDMLRQLGYEVMRVANANAALGALENDRAVDVVFSDIMMPGTMDGIDLALEIRARRRELPVLLTSGFAEANLRRAETEGLRILSKPYTLDDLGNALLSVRKATLGAEGLSARSSG